MFGLGQLWSLADPAAFAIFHGGRRRRAVLQPGPQLGPFMRQLGAFEPTIPPAHGFLQEADGRPGQAVMGIEMRPRPNDRSRGTFRPGERGTALA